MTDPSYPSPGAVLETALAQICHEGFSMTVANTDICLADQSQNMWALVQTENSKLFAHFPNLMSISVTGKDAETALGWSDVSCVHTKHVGKIKFNFRREAASKNSCII